MTKPPNCFKIGALNCQGLRDKIDFPEVQDLIRSCDIFGVCETWLGDEDDIYIAPSGVQKERIKPDQLFCTDMAGSKFEKPCDDKLKLSECTPLFMNAYNLRDAGAVMHRMGF